MDHDFSGQGGDVNSSQGEDISIQELWHSFLEHLWLIFLITAAAVAAGFVYVKLSPVIYESRVVLEVEQNEQNVLGGNVQDFQKQELRNIETMNTIVQGLKSAEVLKRVLEKGKLYQDPRIIGETTNKVSDARALEMFSGMVDTKLRRFTRLIDLTVQHEQPAFAKAMVQEVAEQYLAKDIEQRLGTGSEANRYLVAEAVKLREKLKQSESVMQAYLATNTVAIQENEDIVTAELKELNRSYAAAKAERLSLEADWGQIQEFGKDAQKLMTLPSVLKSPAVAQIKAKLVAQQAEMANLRQRYKDKHPKWIEASRGLESLQKALAEEVTRAPDGIKVEFDTAVVKESNLAKALKEHEAKVADLQRRRITFNVLKSEAEQDRKIYDAIQSRLREVGVSQGIEKQSVRIFESASEPLRPVKPRKTLIIAFSLFAGFSISIGLVWLIQQLDKTIKSVDQAERLFRIPVLGAVPRNASVKSDSERLAVHEQPNSLSAESFRTLRAAISLLGREDERKVVLFTSAVPSEGKTFCCANYAVAYSQQGKRTLAIDFDLRKPALGGTFAIDRKVAGVTDCILGRKSFDECVVSTQYKGLDIMPAGSMVPNPSELLAGKHAEELIDQATAKYDQVIIDNAPVNAVSDTLLLLRKVQTICLVARAAKTSHRVVSRALEMIRRAGAKPSGLVLNFVPEKGKSGYYYYYYSGKDYYGSYGSKENKA